MGEEGNGRGPTWKTWALLGGSIIGALGSALVGFYVTSINKQFEAVTKSMEGQKKTFVAIVKTLKKIEKNLDKLGVKVLGATWLDVKDGKEISGIPLMVLSRQKSKTVKALKARMVRLLSQTKDASKNKTEVAALQLKVRQLSDEIEKAKTIFRTSSVPGAMRYAVPGYSRYKWRYPFLKDHKKKRDRYPRASPRPEKKRVAPPVKRIEKKKFVPLCPPARRK